MTNMLISAMTSVYVRVVFNAKSLKESMIAMTYYVLLISAFSFFFFKVWDYEHRKIDISC